jgi:hypothetical protein
MRRLLAPLLLACAIAPARADVSAEWNLRAETIGLEKGIGAPPNARTHAILHVAMFEAANAVERRYAPYRLDLSDRSASAEAAAAAAGHAVLTTVYPDRREQLDALLATLLANVPDGAAKKAGVALGQKAAAGILAWRAENPAQPEAYRPHTTAGMYVPTVVPAAVTHGASVPWAMSSGSQFRPGPPPALDSDTWASDLKEVRDLGGRNSTVRSAEQTDIGRFWFLTGPPSWNPLVRHMRAAKKLGTVDSARLFALTAMAGDDALIAVFDAKYTYNFWRPYTAVRNADLVAKTASLRDPSWLPLGDTPMHPEYPCAHCITSGAVAAVLIAIVGNEIPGNPDMTSASARGVIRRWSRVEDYANEVSVARIYAGFHYRNSTKVGLEMGRQIGELAVRTRLRPASS